MAMEKQTRLIMERLAALEAKIEIPQLDTIEAKLDALIAVLIPAGQAKPEEKPAKKLGIGENKS